MCSGVLFFSLCRSYVLFFFSLCRLVVFFSYAVRVTVPYGFMRCAWPVSMGNDLPDRKHQHIPSLHFPPSLCVAQVCGQKPPHRRRSCVPVSTVSSRTPTTATASTSVTSTSRSTSSVPKIWASMMPHMSVITCRKYRVV